MWARVGRVLAISCMVLTVRIDSSILTTEAFQTRSHTRTNLKHVTDATHSQLAPPLFHRFNPLRINPDGSRRKNLMKTVNVMAPTPSPVKPSKDGGVDSSAIYKYAFAIFVQVNLVYLFFRGLDLMLVPYLHVPFFVNAVFMYVLALKSRIFNPLSNSRPRPQTNEIQGAIQRKMPTWTPPGFVFPVVWLLLIGPLRAVTSAMIIKASGGIYSSPALLALVLHLSIGDVWNTINNVERRYGTSVLGVLFVWISAAFAAWRFFLVDPLAGKLLSLKLVWLSVATSLIARTWQLNPNPSTGEIASLLPTKGDGFTQFEWFHKEDMVAAIED